jgi:spermidine synthase
MGSTLPLLFAALLPQSRNVGRTVGLLYFVNTLGSATACFVAAAFTMRWLGQSGSVAMAATINAVLGVAVLLLARASSRWQAPTGREPIAAGARTTLLSFPMAAGLVALAGFISLSYEIVWFRAYSFTSGSDARTFAHVLGAYLVGLALGSLASGVLCRTLGAGDVPRYLRLGALFIVGANVLAYLTLPVLARTVTVWHHASTLPLVAVGAALLGAVLPLVTHIAIGPGDRAGMRLSYLYLANILGSAAGSFVTGFVALDRWSLERICVSLALFGISLGTLVLLAASRGTVERAGTVVVAGAVAASVLISHGALFEDLYERLQLKREYAESLRFAHTVETKAGVITVSSGGTVYGGGVLDGRFNVDLVDDSNWILRAYAISAVHQAPREVLMIGLGSGSWAQVIAHNPDVTRLTIVEINRGYVELMAMYPDVRSLLTNPKVTIALDDGRRWLRRHADRRFDFVVMNTTWNWRAHASNMLSQEFMQLVRERLEPGGVLFYNTTWSGEAQLTGLTVFPHGLRMINCLFVSDTPITFDRARWRHLLQTYRVDGRPVLDLTREDHRQRLDELLAFDDFEAGEAVRRANADRRPITDDNMGTEWSTTPRRS